jgi:hypothetical protein
MKFYSLINSESNKSLPIIRVSPTVIGDPGDEYAERDTDVVYRVSDHFETDQPLLLNNKESAIHLLADPCLEIEDSHYENPCFDEVEEWVEFLVPVEIEITDTPLNKESMEISLYEIDESHNLFSKQSPCHSYKKDGNKFIQYIDKLPPAEAEYWDDAVREFFLSDSLNELAIIIEHEDFKVYGKKLDFSDDTFNKVKKYLTITKL